MSAKPCASHELFIGALVMWRHRPRGGFGYELPIEAEIVNLALDGTLAAIRIRDARGRVAHRTVSHETLTWRPR